MFGCPAHPAGHGEDGEEGRQKHEQVLMRREMLHRDGGGNEDDEPIEHAALLSLVRQRRWIEVEG
jgi:hypothetical protein